MSPLAPIRLASNGLLLDMDHKPVVYLQTIAAGKVVSGLLLTHIELEHGWEAYGLLDFGNGKARMSILFLDHLKS